MKVSLSPQFTDKDWNGIDFRTEAGWQRAIDIAEDRVCGRWLQWIDCFVHRKYSGFAVLALDCIVLESLWGFMNGKPVPQGRVREVYRDILNTPRFGWTDAQGDSFREFVRNGLMHDAETRNRWKVEMSIPRDSIISQNKHGDYVINRSKFHKALKGAVADWIQAVRGGDVALRQKMRDRMEKIIYTHYRT